MSERSPSGAIAQRPSGRADLLAFEVAGRLTAPDVEWMAARATDGFDRLGTVDMLIVVRDWQGADLGAMADPAMLTAQLRSLRHVRRYAVVGAPAWARTMIAASDKLIPVEAKTFDAGAEAAAEAWLRQQSV